VPHNLFEAPKKEHFYAYGCASLFHTGIVTWATAQGQ
jgi:hypothetical protein